MNDCGCSDDVLDRLADAHRECYNDHLDPIMRKVNSLSSYPVNIVRENDSFPNSVKLCSSQDKSGLSSARLAMQRFVESQLQRPSENTTDKKHPSAFVEYDNNGIVSAFVIQMDTPGADLSAIPETTRVLPGQDIPFVKLDNVPDILTTAALHALDKEQIVGFGAITQRLQQHIAGVSLNDIPQLMMAILGNAGMQFFV